MPDSAQPAPAAASAPEPTGQATGTPTSWSLAGVYAEAVLGLYESNEDAERAAAELDEIAKLTGGAEGFDRLLTGLSGSRRKARQFVGRVFGGRVSPPIEGLLGVMALKGRLHLLRQVARRFRHMLNRREGKVEVVVTTAVPLDDDQQARLRDVLRDALGAEPLLHCRVDASVLGGAVIQVGDRLYDASIASELRRLRRQIAEGKTRLFGQAAGRSRADRHEGT